MSQKMMRLFVLSAGGVLLLASMAKIISSFGTAEVLQINDPILMLTFRCVFRITGVLELAVAAVCFFGSGVSFQAWSVAFVAANFLIYRAGLLLIGYHKPCSCLGNLTDALHIRPQTADAVMKIILAYLLIGSCATLFWLWRQKRKTPSLTPPEETSIPAS